MDRPETVARLEAIIADLVGQEIRIRFRTSEAVGPATKSNPILIPAQRTQIVDETDDPYLQEVTKLFGVKSWKVKEVIVEAAENDPASMGTE